MARPSRPTLGTSTQGILPSDLQMETMMTTLYTVTDCNSGDMIDTACTAAEAMHIILTDDGHQYEIRPEADGDGFRLWTSTYSRNSTAWNGLTKSTVYSLEVDAEKAEQEIAEKVIAAGWPRKPEAMTDERYAEMLAEMEG